MHLVVLGSGTVVPEPDRSCASYFLDAGTVRLLLDCGPGATHSMARLGLPWASITHVAVTHFHTDHIGDLPYLLFALKHALATPRTEPLTLLGPPGTVDRLRALAEAFGSYVLDPGFRMTARELGDGHSVELAPGLRLLAHRTAHTDASVAYRLDGDGLPRPLLAYTGDTGPDPALAAWVSGADTLLMECSLPDALGFDKHMTPSGVAAFANVAAPQRLLLTHVYPQLDRNALPALVADAGYRGDVAVVADGDELQVPHPAAP